MLLMNALTVIQDGTLSTHRAYGLSSCRFSDHFSLFQYLLAKKTIHWILG
jgi:hypothetical protein